MVLSRKKYGGREKFGGEKLYDPKNTLLMMIEA